MKLTKRQAKAVNHALTHWESEGMIQADQASELRQSYEVVGFDWKLLAVYSFWIAITCFIISIAVLLADDYLMELLAKIIDTPASVLAIISAILAALAFRLGFQRRQRFPDKAISNEAIYFFGVLLSAVSVGFLRETSLLESLHIVWFLLILTVLYAALALRLSSMLIWMFALLGFAAWGLELISLLAEPGGYFLGLNLPCWMIVIALIVLGGSKWLGRLSQYVTLYEPTRFVGLLYLLSALWLVSIFGNYENAAEWSQVSQLRMLPWAFLSGVVCVALLVFGIRQEDKLARGFGITFLLINLYTRYFEYFWDAMHKTLFFAILALSFWVIGSQAENLWQLSRRGENRSAD